MTATGLGSSGDIAQVCESVGLIQSSAGDEWADGQVVVWVQMFDHGAVRKVVVYRHPAKAEPGFDFVAEVSPNASSRLLLAAITDARGQSDDDLVEAVAEWLHSWSGDRFGHPWSATGETRRLILRARARGVLNILRYGHPEDPTDEAPLASAPARPDPGSQP